MAKVSLNRSDWEEIRQWFPSVIFLGVDMFNIFCREFYAGSKWAPWNVEVLESGKYYPDLISKWKSWTNLGAKAMEMKWNKIIQIWKINNLWLMRIWAYKCKLQSLYARKERKIWVHLWVIRRLWHGCENNNKILECMKQGTLITHRKILLPFCNILSGSYSKYCIQYYSADNDEIYLN